MRSYYQLLIFCTVGLNSLFNTLQALARCTAGGALCASSTVQDGSLTNPWPFGELICGTDQRYSRARLARKGPRTCRLQPLRLLPALPARACGGGAVGGAGRRWRARGGGSPSPSRSGSSRAARAARVGCVAARDPSHRAWAGKTLLPPPHSPARPRRAAPGPPLPPCPPLTQSVPHQLQHGGSAALSSAELRGPPAGEWRPRRRAAPGARVAEWGPSPGPRRGLGGRWRRRSRYRGAWGSVTAREGAPALPGWPDRRVGAGLGRPPPPRARPSRGPAALVRGAGRPRRSAHPGWGRPLRGKGVRSCECGPRLARAAGVGEAAPGVGSARPAVPLRSLAGRGSVSAASALLGWWLGSLNESSLLP